MNSLKMCMFRGNVHFFISGLDFELCPWSKSVSLLLIHIQIYKYYRTKMLTFSQKALFLLSFLIITHERLS